MKGWFSRRVHSNWMRVKFNNAVFRHNSWEMRQPNTLDPLVYQLWPFYNALMLDTRRKDG